VVTGIDNFEMIKRNFSGRLEKFLLLVILELTLKGSCYDHCFWLPT